MLLGSGPAHRGYLVGHGENGHWPDSSDVPYYDKALPIWVAVCVCLRSQGKCRAL